VASAQLVSLFHAYIQSSQNKTLFSDKRSCDYSNDSLVGEIYSFPNQDQIVKRQAILDDLQTAIRMLNNAKGNAGFYDWQAHKKDVRQESIDIPLDKPNGQTFTEKTIRMFSKHQTGDIPADVKQKSEKQDTVPKVPFKVQFKSLPFEKQVTLIDGRPLQRGQLLFGKAYDLVLPVHELVMNEWIRLSSCTSGDENLSLKDKVVPIAEDPF
jgi:hypothetical protein